MTSFLTKSCCMTASDRVSNKSWSLARVRCEVGYRLRIGSRILEKEGDGIFGALPHGWSLSFDDHVILLLGFIHLRNDEFTSKVTITKYLNKTLTFLNKCKTYAFQTFSRRQGSSWLHPWHPWGCSWRRHVWTLDETIVWRRILTRKSIYKHVFSSRWRLSSLFFSLFSFSVKIPKASSNDGRRLSAPEIFNFFSTEYAELLICISTTSRFFVLNVNHIEMENKYTFSVTI